MATEKQTATRVFDALSETSTALMEPVKAGLDRTHRFATAVVREAEWVQQETLGFGRRLAEEPGNVLGNAGTAVQKAGEAQDRAFEFVRLSIDEVATAAREARTAFEKVARANLELGQPAIEAVQGLVTRTREAVRPIVPFGGDGAKESAPATSRTRRSGGSSEEAA